MLNNNFNQRGGKAYQLSQVTSYSYDEINKLQQTLRCSDDALEWLIHFSDWYHLSLNDIIKAQRNEIPGIKKV